MVDMLLEQLRVLHLADCSTLKENFGTSKVIMKTMETVTRYLSREDNLATEPWRSFRGLAYYDHEGDNGTMLADVTLRELRVLHLDLEIAGRRERDSGPGLRFSNLKAHEGYTYSKKATPPHPFE
ncbi:hypothetical protein STEG23_003795 [Scotinomys teguina]